MAVKLGVGSLVLLGLMGLMVPRAAANVQTEYFEIGQSLVLMPTFSERITSITWKYRGDLVAEWIEDRLELEYLGDLKGRAELDLTTGTLTVRNMAKSDDGPFVVEINNQVLPDSFNAVGVNRLDNFTVEIRVQPLACASKGSCTLVCDGKFQDAGPIRYFWKFGEKGEWKEGGDQNKATVSEADSKEFKSFICKAKNPVSEKQSAPQDNPFIKETHPGNTVLVVGIVLGSIVVGAICIFIIIAYLKPEVMPRRVQDIVRRFRPNAGGDSGGPTANGTGSETVPMNQEPLNQKSVDPPQSELPLSN